MQGELAQLGPGLRPRSTIGAIRDAHHWVARLFAMGYSQTEVAQETGYSLNRIGILHRDPAIQELISKYRETIVNPGVRDGVAEFMQNLVVLRNAAVRHAIEHYHRADENDELVSQSINAKFIADGSDRTGFPKLTVTAKADGDFADLLDRAIARSGKTIASEAATSVRGKVIDMQVGSPSGPAPSIVGPASLGPTRTAGRSPSPPTAAPQSFRRRA